MGRNQEILEKAIQKAIDGGWSTYSDKWHFEGNAVIWEGETTTYREAIRSLIYDHDFAKALWGEEMYYYSDDMPALPMHQFNLCQMVIAEDPIKYLGDNL